LWLVGCAIVLAAIALARVPRVQIEIDKLGTVADRPGVTNALARFVAKVLTRTRTGEPPAANVATPPFAHTPTSPTTTASPSPRSTHGESPTPEPAATHANGSQRVRHQAHPPRQPVEPTVAAADEPPSPSPDADGVLRINSLPWTEVSIDGDWVGTTPQREIKLRPGRHKIKLVNPEMRLVRMFTVQIQAGETVTKSVLLEP
jgi:hypothetical protein